MLLNAARPLVDLHEQWSSCVACELGQRRKSFDRRFVPGKGSLRGIMFVGEGPGEKEEIEGIPFAGLSERLLSKTVDKIGISEFCYFTNLVTCRSCIAETNDSGAIVVIRRNGEEQIKYRDQAPTPAQISACSARLYEEIYIVDPLVIIALGATAATALAGRKVAILQEAGREMHVEIPGVGCQPSITPGGKWGRKIHGNWSYPTVRNSVRYLCIPTYHPSFVARSVADKSESSPMKRFYTHVQDAAKTFAKLAEIYGVTTHELGNTANTTITEGPDDIYENL